MIKILLLPFLFFSVLVNAQSFEVSKTNGVVAVTNNANGVVNEYTESGELMAYISSGGTTRNTINIVSSTSSIVIKYKGNASLVYVDGVSYATNEELITELNKLFTK